MNTPDQGAEPGELGLKAFLAARERIRPMIERTPLIRLQVEGRDDIYIKLETLQPVGSFKIRCAANALLRRIDQVRSGVYTASAGNFAQGLAYAGRQVGCPVRTYIPEVAASSKLKALEGLGAEIIRVSHEQWWSMIRQPPDNPSFIHPVCDPDVMAGNGTIALEVLEDLPSVATIIAPYGGGGLTIGIAAALKAAGSNAKTIACEIETRAPLTAALAAGRPVEIPFEPSTFITGIGGRSVLPSMWPLAQALISGAKTVSLAQTAAAIRLLVEQHHLVVEGAGATPVAAALDQRFEGPTVCILSGGHLDPDQLMLILQGVTP
jgi:threonine dehydratase